MMPKTPHWRADMPRRVLTYAIDSDADVRASDVRQAGAQMQFNLHLPESPRRSP